MHVNIDGVQVELYTVGYIPAASSVVFRRVACLEVGMLLNTAGGDIMYVTGIFALIFFGRLVSTPTRLIIGRRVVADSRALFYGAFWLPSEDRPTE